MPSSSVSPRDERRLTVRLPAEVYERIRTRAAFEGASGMAEWVRDLLRAETCPHAKAFEGVCGECGHVEVGHAVHG